MRLFLTGLLAAALLAAAQTGTAPASPASTKKSAKDKATLEAYVRHMFVWSKQINVAVSDPKPAPFKGFAEYTVTASAGNARQDETFYISDDGQTILRGNVFDVNSNPFKKDLDRIKTEFQPSYGTPGAPVVIVMFSDFQCSFCKEEAKMMRQNLISTFPKEVRVYFKDYPLDQIHPWARPASIAGRCVFRQEAGKFWDFHDWIYEQQASVTPENFRGKFEEWAGNAKLDTVSTMKCFDSKATEAEVNKNKDEGAALSVNSTPTLFLNGRRLVGQIGWPQLRQIIEYEIEYQRTAKNAGEDCGCEVKLPSPLGNQ